MRAADDRASLTPAQAAAAAAGLKAMIPIDRPFLDYVLSALADAGFTDICLVVGPEHDAIRQYYGRALQPERLRIGFAIQPEPKGTADAVLMASAFAAGEPFVVLNADNYYPSDALAALRRAPPPASLAFRRAGLLRDGQIPPERIAKYAVLDIGADGCLTRVLEKPAADALAAAGPDPWVSMNCWLVEEQLRRACREVALSPRGELELPMAVQHAIERFGACVTAVCVDAGVLDLSHRGDVAGVAERLRGVPVRL
jgi:glucose-1-phosphate thymidylyltransferase